MAKADFLLLNLYYTISIDTIMAKASAVISINPTLKRGVNSKRKSALALI